jgi:hypothetical protein
MFNRMVVQEALRQTRISNKALGLKINKPEVVQDSEVSLLIHDVFGGEILKTHNKRGWHFYNRINGERIDFTRSEKGKKSEENISEENIFEDILSTPDETQNYFSREDYSTFFMRFVGAFEETVGLEKYQQSASA